MVTLFLTWKGSNLLFCIPIRALISFNVRTELEIIQFLNVAIVIGNELKVSVGPQAAVKRAAKLLQIGAGSYEGKSL